jgi:hypothetical protein
VLASAGYHGGGSGATEPAGRDGLLHRGPGSEALLRTARGRTIFGELEAYGVPWRSGANEATALHLTFAADIGSVALEPGSYSLYTIPGEEAWEVVLNSNAQRWGIPISPEVRADDVGSFTVPAEATEAPVETLTYRWEPTGGSAGHLLLEWENTRIRIPVASAGM